MDNLLKKFDSIKGFLAEDEGIFLYVLTRVDLNLLCCHKYSWGWLVILLSIKLLRSLEKVISDALFKSNSSISIRYLLSLIKLFKKYVLHDVALTILRGAVIVAAGLPKKLTTSDWPRP